MKQISSLSLLLAAVALTTVLFAPQALAAEEIHEEHQVKLKVMAGDELVTVDLSDLELGQSKQITTDSGKLITATRDDQGYELDIEGKKIRIGGHGHSGVQVHSDGDDRVVIHERQVHREIREIRLDDGDVIKIEGPLDLELGDTRELTTNNGASATLSRDDEGLLLSVGGEEIRLPKHRALAMAFSSAGEGEHVMHWQTDGNAEAYGFRHVVVDCEDDDEDCAERIKLHTQGSSVIILREDGDELHIDGDSDGEHRVMFIELDEEIETEEESEPRSR